MNEAEPVELPPLPLPNGIIETYVKTNDLTYHVLSAGVPGSPLILCLHGFLDLAWSWKEVMPILVSGGYHVIAYDQRGYGRTTGWDTRSWAEVDLHTFTFSRLVTDAVRLIAALGYKEVTMVLGHNLGSAVANLCALIRPDIFKSVITVSRPNAVPPNFPFNTNSPPAPPVTINEVLASLPVPRQTITQYYASETANTDLMIPSKNIYSFLQQYFFAQSHLWPGNQEPAPHPLSSSSIEQLAALPTYLIPPRSSTIKEALASLLANSHISLTQVASLTSPFLTHSDLSILTEEFTRTSFVGALNWHRVLSSPCLTLELEIFAGRKVEVPSLFVAGDRDWGTYAESGIFEGLYDGNKRFFGARMLSDCGANPQWERPEELSAVVLGFLAEIRDRVVGVTVVDASGSALGIGSRDGLGLGLATGVGNLSGVSMTGESLLDSPGSPGGSTRKRAREEVDEPEDRAEEAETEAHEKPKKKRRKRRKK